MNQNKLLQPHIMYIIKKKINNVEKNCSNPIAYVLELQQS